MLLWECRRRLKCLVEFNRAGSVYFRNIRITDYGTTVIENDEARRARRDMNRTMGDVIAALDLAGVSHTVYYSPPPMLGGLAGPLDLVANIFELPNYRIEANRVQDILDRGIGVYERLERNLKRQLFNPFFWVNWALKSVLSVPFRILSAAGFDGGSIERSVVGKVLKLVGQVLVYGVAFLTILEKLGHLERFKSWVLHLGR